MGSLKPSVPICSLSSAYMFGTCEHYHTQILIALSGAGLS